MTSCGAVANILKRHILKRHILKRHILKRHILKRHILKRHILKRRRTAASTRYNMTIYYRVAMISRLLTNIRLFCRI